MALYSVHNQASQIISTSSPVLQTLRLQAFLQQDQESCQKILDALPQELINLNISRILHSQEHLVIFSRQE